MNPAEFSTVLPTVCTGSRKRCGKDGAECKARSQAVLERFARALALHKRALWQYSAPFPTVPDDGRRKTKPGDAAVRTFLKG